jgi:hypothetical protein
MYLRQATSASVQLGPFVSSDGVGLVSLTISPQLIRLSKNEGNFAAKTLVASNAIHNENAWYSTIFDNTDTGSVGRLLMACSIATALPVWKEYVVLPTSIYDYFIQGSVLQNVALGRSAIDSGALAVGGVERLANLFTVDLSSLSIAVNARSPANALRAVRNRVTTSGTVMTVYGEDDTTAVWTGTITTNASADPIVEVNPA